MLILGNSFIILSDWKLEAYQVHIKKVIRRTMEFSISVSICLLLSRAILLPEKIQKQKHLFL